MTLRSKPIPLVASYGLLLWVVLNGGCFAMSLDWVQLGGENHWTASSGYQVVEFNGRLVLTGGMDYSPPARVMNEMWLSSDGIEWTSATTSVPWPARTGHCAAVFRDALYLVGGQGRNYELLKDVWRTTDTLHWQKIDDIPFAPRVYGALAVHQDMLYLIGGDVGYDSPMKNDVWRTSDGLQWTSVTQATDWGITPSRSERSARFGHEALSFDNRLWIIGGSFTNEFIPDYIIETNQVFSSTDGAHWTTKTEEAEWPGRSFPGAVAYDDQLWVMGGVNIDFIPQVYSDVWSSADGREWRKVSFNTPWCARVVDSVLVFNDAMLIVGGSGYKDVWRSNGFKNRAAHWEFY